MARVYQGAGAEDTTSQAERDIAEWGPHQPIRFRIKRVIQVME